MNFVKHLWIVGFAVICACSAEPTNKVGLGTFAGTKGGAGNGGINSTDTTFSPGDEGSLPLGQGGGSMQPISSAGQGGDTCGSVKVESTAKIGERPGNILVVADRSASMSNAWGNVPKYQAAADALTQAITPLQDLLTVGGVFFPSTGTGEQCDPVNPAHWIPGPDAYCLNVYGASCGVNDISSPDQISFRPAAQFIAQLPNQWSVLGGMTPLEVGVKQADAALSSATLNGSISVVIMSDGIPDCGDNTDNINTAVSEWAAKGIKTYVIGLPGTSDSAAVDLLNNIAVHGGTNKYLDPADSATLAQEFSGILIDTIKVGLESCTIKLTLTADTDVNQLHVVVVEGGQTMEVPRVLTSGGGWTVSPDGTTATLEGNLCEDAKNARFEVVEFTFGCETLPILQ